MSTERKLHRRATLVFCVGVLLLLTLGVLWKRGDQNDEGDSEASSRHTGQSLAHQRKASKSTRSKLEPRSDTDDGEEGERQQELAQKYRIIGAEFIQSQHAFLESVEDSRRRRELERVLTQSNRLWLAAIITEMAQHSGYRADIVDLANDGQFRVFAIDTIGDLMPELVRHLKTGHRVGGSDLERLLPEDRDFLSEFDEVSVGLPEDMVARFESAIGSWVAGDLLARRHLIESPNAPSDNGFQFFWGVPKPDPID